MTPPSTLIFLRHAQTPWNKAGLTMGQSDIPLSDLGKREADLAAAALKAFPIDVIVCSHLKRCLQTISPFRGVGGYKIHINPLRPTDHQALVTNLMLLSTTFLMQSQCVFGEISIRGRLGSLGLLRFLRTSPANFSFCEIAPAMRQGDKILMAASSRCNRHAHKA